MSTKTIARNGFTLTMPTNIRKDAYVRVIARINDPSRFANGDDAWNAVVDEIVKIFGTFPTEDGTVGQYTQTRYGLSTGMVFSFGLNLYGLKIRPILAAVAACS